MEEVPALKIIAHIHTPFATKFGAPRQAGLVEALKGQVVFEKEYRVPEAVRGLEEFSHIWLLWQFSGTVGRAWRPTVRPPRLGGNARVGVFATRSPFRPNPIGLSCLRLERVELSGPQGPVLHVAGPDLMDGTPIYDIKPYLPYADSRPEASGGFAAGPPAPLLQVRAAPELTVRLPAPLWQALQGVLAQDPRPPYQDDPGRVYGLDFGGWRVRFGVEGRVLTVRELIPLPLDSPKTP